VLLGVGRGLFGFRGIWAFASIYCVAGGLLCGLTSAVMSCQRQGTGMSHSATLAGVAGSTEQTLSLCEQRFGLQPGEDRSQRGQRFLSTGLTQARPDQCR
jgi:hypothetical protein